MTVAAVCHANLIPKLVSLRPAQPCHADMLGVHWQQGAQLGAEAEVAAPRWPGRMCLCEACSQGVTAAWGRAGHTNGFHVASKSSLAMCYNDASVMENHHCAMTFSILERADCALLQHLDPGLQRVGACPALCPQLYAVCCIASHVRPLLLLPAHAASCPAKNMGTEWLDGVMWPLRTFPASLHAVNSNLHRTPPMTSSTLLSGHGLWSSRS